MHTTIRQIRKYANPLISQKIIVSDQSDRYTHSQIVERYGKDEDIAIVWTRGLYSGFGFDTILRDVEITSEYICQLHADAMPIHANWLYLPIKLIEEYNLSFVGQLQCINFDSSIYPPSTFFAMAQCFNVARTETYKELSLQAGFTRFHNRPETGLEFENNEWAEWAAADYDNRGSDDDIVAFSWQDRHTKADKLGLAISGYVQPSFGRIIDGVVFHFGSANEARPNMGTMPYEYQEFTRRINNDYNDSLIDEMVALAKANKPNGSQILTRNFWNGTTKTVSPPSDEMNNRIEELKNA